MNLRDLKYLLMVAREKHFAKAADKSFVSQPTLSMQIKKLEDELGVKIFERSKKQFLVTSIGKEILQKVEVVLQEVDEIKKLAKRSIDPYSQELLIGAFPTLAPYFFPKIIKIISKKFPKLKILLVEEKTESLIKKISNGDLDIAFVASSLNQNDYHSIKIFEENFLLAVPKNHQLAKKKIIKSQDLNNQELMLLEDGHCMRDQAMEFCFSVGASEKQTFRASSLETLKQMIKAGSGITFVPEIAAKKDDGICYLKIEKPAKRSIFLCYRKNSVKKKITEEIKDLINS
jgi:LysR family hydrogen peroxide-inducible transcriptional activator